MAPSYPHPYTDILFSTYAFADFVCLKAVVSVNPLQRNRECTRGHLNVLSASFCPRKAPRDAPSM